MKLTLIIEATADPALIPRMISAADGRSRWRCAEGAVHRAAAAGRCWSAMQRGSSSFRERAECKDGVIYFDITDRQLEGTNKFSRTSCTRRRRTTSAEQVEFRTKVRWARNP